jgi:hypothetical protein
MIDIVVQGELKQTHEHADLFDQELYLSCINYYSKQSNTNSNNAMLKDVYFFYHNLCPEYELFID